MSKANGRIRVTDEEFVLAAKQALSYEELGERLGYSMDSARLRAGQLRRAGHDVPKLQRNKPSLEFEYDNRADPLPQTATLPDDSTAAYAACAFDLCGDFSSRLNADPARRVVVKAKMVTTQRAVLDVVKSRYGGEIVKSGDAVVSAYVLTWPDEMVLHGFLSAIVAYSVRWREQIQPVLSYLEQYALLKMYEVELIRMLESKASGK